MKNTVLLFILVLFWQKTMTAQSKCDSGKYVSAYGSDSLLLKAIGDWYAKGYFDKLLKKHGIRKISCAGCDAAYVDLTFTINAQGRIIPGKVHQSRICTGKASEKFLEDFYAILIYVKAPKNMGINCYRYRFGRALKC